MASRIAATASNPLASGLDRFVGGNMNVANTEVVEAERR